jgi:hypothetical protein
MQMLMIVPMIYFMRKFIKYIKLNGIIPMKTYIEYACQGWLFKESLSLLKKLLVKTNHI